MTFPELENLSLWMVGTLGPYLWLGACCVQAPLFPHPGVPCWYLEQDVNASTNVNVDDIKEICVNEQVQFFL